MVLGKVRRAVVQLLLSLKFFHSLGVYPCSFRLCVVLLFYKVALPVQVRKQLNFCQISSSSSSAFDVMTVLNPQAGGC